ncbi:MAG TPA: endo-1,4-beta-xylanase [Humisphaera sp.]
MRTAIMLGVLLGLTAAGGRTTRAADAPASPDVPGRWTEQQANDWHKRTGWLVGANYTPATAINQLEMWQADSFDPATIDRELAMAESLGFNSMRVFLHHLVWEQDAEGLYKRMDQFLGIAEKHKVRVMFVLFDSCWDPEPKLGKQRPPKKGVHNSGWVQSPGKADLMDAKRHPVLEAYVKGVVGRFKDDARVVVWDVWNEPDNQNDNSYGKNHLKTEPAGKLQATIPLLAKAFEWARAAKPSQPLTSGPWIGPKKPQDALSTTEQVQVHHSDVITFHTYNEPAGVEKWIAYYKKFNRPMLCTEYMARPNGSRFDPTLQIFKDAGVGAYCWGFVAGKTNTIHAWKTWQEPEPKDEPTVWFHDIFRPDGSAFDAKEVEYIKRVTGKAGK